MATTLAELWRHRTLLWQFTLRQVELRHKGSHLGLVWSFLGPLLMLSLYVLVFGFIFDGRFRAEDVPESRIEYALAVFLGLAILHFVSEVMTLSPGLIVANPNFVKKVVFPLSVLPAASVGAALVHFVITLGLVLLGAMLTGAPISWSTAWWLPILLLPLAAAALGLGLALSALGVFWRDLMQITQFLALALLFASAVFYPIRDIPPAAWEILRFNPMVHWIDESRNALFWAQAPRVNHLAFLYVMGTACLLLGGGIFRRLRPTFADVL